MTQVLPNQEDTSTPPNGKCSPLPPALDASESSTTRPFVSPAKKVSPTGNKGLILLLAGGTLIALIAVILALSTTAKTKRRSDSDPQRANSGQQDTASEPTKRITPADQLAPERQNEEDSVTPADIARTKNAIKMPGQKTSETTSTPGVTPNAPGGAVNAPGTATPAGKQLATIEPFQQPKIGVQQQQPWAPQPYAGQPYSGPSGLQASSQEAIRLQKEEVTKASMVFTLRRQQPVFQATGSPGITNFGLETGFHVAVRLEASASSAVAAPVTAVVEYNYQRNGQILIPAGSRAIGKIDGADRQGNVGISFFSIDLPDGTPVPISAVAVDTNLRTVKGVVTGSNRGKGIIVGTLSGIGQAAAMLVGQSSSSMNAAYSQNDVIRDRLAQNAGSVGDTQVQRLIASEKIVVTVPAGTELYMVFTKPAAAVKTSTQAAAGTNPAVSTNPSSTPHQ
jgi:hypothetical protein